MASGFSAYAWLRRLGNKSAALIGALLYMGAPYHLEVDLYQRFAFAELWGFVWMPLVLWRVHAVVEGRKGAWLGLAASYALLIMTHLQTTLLFSLVPPLYTLWIAKTGYRVLVGATVAGAMLLGIGLSAVFLMPALLMQPFVQFNAMESGLFYYGNNFLFYGPRFDLRAEEILKYMDLVMASSVMVIAGAYGLGQRLLPLSGKRVAHFWLLVGAVVFFMMLPLSKPLWVLLPVIQKVQFPFRFGAVLMLPMAALLTLWLGGAGRLLARTNITLLVIVGLVGLTQTIPVLKVYQAYPSWSKKPRLNDLFAREDPAKVIIAAAKIGSCTDFLPNRVAPLLLGIPFGVRQSLDMLHALAALPQISAVRPTSGISQLQLSQVSPRHLVLAVNSDTPASLRVRQFYFPGWTATAPDISGELKLGPARDSGLIEVEVPAGRHNIDLILLTTPVERTGQIISLLSAMVFLVGLARLRYLARGEGRSMSVRQDMPVQVETADQISHLKQD